MTVDIAHLRRLIEAFESSDWESIHLTGEDFEIMLSTNAEAAVESPAGVSASQAPDATPVSEPEPAMPAAEPEEPKPSARAAEGTGAEGEPVVSPSVGIFWRAPSPSSPPFVELGDEVTPESTLCIVEVMKLMTQVGPQVSGTVVDVLVANGEQVVKGQPLFTLETS